MNAPTLTARDADLDAARRAVTAAAEEADRALDAAPARRERGPERQRALDELVRAARRARAALMARHGQRVYDELTDGGTARPTLAELVFAAAERFPGLVPTRERLAAEAGLTQAEKDGHEIDQAIFLAGVLRAERAGAHLLESMLQPTPEALALLPHYRETGHVDLGRIDLRRRDGVAELTITRPERLNAEDNALVAALDTAVDLVLADDLSVVGVLRGGVMTHPRYVGRRVFCAGIDLVDLHHGRISFVDFLVRRELAPIAKIWRGLRIGDDDLLEPPRAKPWIAAVDTFAIGGGMQLLFVFDRVLAARDAYFSLPAAAEGIVPGAGNLRLPRLAGNRAARQVILSGRRIRADEPLAAWICDEVVEPDRLGEEIGRHAAGLTLPAVRANRELLNLAEEPPWATQQYFAEFAVRQAQRMYAPDVLAKVSRFAAKGA
ncbi:(3,5-dihydroxyphenyl)acetyl-CoA 1,2-dioxygenase DpgC [Micromonospora sp. HM5-17]|uniref:(3,5-dihydroxyphenyl)acetyl-CoA 1,2-dioxygenase DpgC n=1 Tax=Micromonospora sp. HM5-17 TaxID=2487710 RepID=UPI0018F37F1D|nr:(3,5-dihydroxyphenyl)acetyl-CoA 1,2-dioxygenase DpgC [Micromonospora sp. HM5-17]